MLIIYTFFLSFFLSSYMHRQWAHSHTCSCADNNKFFTNTIENRPLQQVCKMPKLYFPIFKLRRRHVHKESKKKIKFICYCAFLVFIYFERRAAIQYILDVDLVTNSCKWEIRSSGTNSTHLYNLTHLQTNLAFPFQIT